MAEPKLRKIRTRPRPGASVTRQQVRAAVKAVMREKAEREAAEKAAQSQKRNA
ncbi:MAG TPA: hypothetical protein VEU30_10690 [Thermoanaerobaculia bacterium]|nr:hypothetical protein [Thermoanaerobaculia bacterium]